MKSNNKSMKKGFTLIELILIIGILGVIIAGVVGVLNPIEQFKKSNDAKRKSDLAQMQRALELYYQDYGRYPTSSANFRIFITPTTIDWGSTWQPYIAKLPADPVGSNRYAYYSPVSSSGQTYYLYANLERGGKDAQSCNSGNACATLGGPGFPIANSCGGTCNYGISSSNVTP